MTVRVCFVCLGNICRSPTAEGVFQHQVDAAGLGDAIFVDSAGTAAYHAGEQADPRSRQEAEGRGVPLPSISRQFRPADFRRFDFVLAMDAANLRNLQALDGADAFTGTLALFRAYDPTAPADASVPDPYYGGPRGFADVYDQCARAGEGLLRHIRETRGI
jgi:protein-tyrosine phosphatase